MNRIVPAVFATLLSLCGIAIAQVDPRSADVVEITRESHLNSQTLPDGIAFFENARMISAFAESDQERTADGLAENSGLSPEVAANVVSLTVKALADMNLEVAARQKQMACTESGQQKVYGEATYKMLEQMDDAYELVGEEHLQILLSSLSNSDQAIYMQWLNIRKQDTQYVKIDHKKSHERTGSSADAQLATICSSFERG